LVDGCSEEGEKKEGTGTIPTETGVKRSEGNGPPQKAGPYMIGQEGWIDCGIRRGRREKKRGHDVSCPYI
jgi:hypothetical protein